MSDYLIPIDELSYNPKSSESIIKYAQKLKFKSLKQACEKGTIFESKFGKGNFGNFTEEFYFKYKPNSNPDPDFSGLDSGVDLELKCTGLDKYSNDKGFKIKERLAIKYLNFHKVYNQDFFTSPLYNKIRNLLIVCYIYEKDVADEDKIIRLIDSWLIPKYDLKQINNDFIKINQKIKKGEAHTLSSGDTYFLEAATTGEGGTKVKQPFSNIKAKPRRYALKNSYMNYVLANIVKEKYDTKEQLNFKECIKKYYNLDSILKKSKKKKNIILNDDLTLDELVFKKLSKFYNKTDRKIAEFYNIKYSPSYKAFYPSLIKKILTGEDQKDKKNLQLEIAELVKADIEVRTIRIEQNNKPKQHLSFPAFKFTDIYERTFNESELYNYCNKKFLFIFFKRNINNELVFERSMFWNMPQNDIKKCKMVYGKTKKIISAGEIFDKYKLNKNGDFNISKKGNKIKLNNLPKSKEDDICHVRPHGRDSLDTYPLPIEDKKLKISKYSKQSFWLKNEYIGNIYQNS